MKLSKEDKERLERELSVMLGINLHTGAPLTAEELSKMEGAGVPSSDTKAKTEPGLVETGVRMLNALEKQVVSAGNAITPSGRELAEVVTRAVLAKRGLTPESALRTVDDVTAEEIIRESTRLNIEVALADAAAALTVNEISGNVDIDPSSIRIPAKLLKALGLVRKSDLAGDEAVAKIKRDADTAFERLRSEVRAGLIELADALK